MNYVYQQVLQRLLSYFNRAERTALQLLIQRLIVAAGGIENIVYSWPLADLATFDPMATETPQFLKQPEEMSNGERQFARKCSICHALTGDTARKAGPTLHNIFGRRAGTIPDYPYSATLSGSDIVWSEATIDQLFLDGPDHYIPGSKMPMLKVRSTSSKSSVMARTGVAMTWMSAVA